ncbi:MAG TPA: hypothetical protein VF006_18165 [Longimicrobium sp.]
MDGFGGSGQARAAETPLLSVLERLAAAWREEAAGLRRRYGMRQLASLCEAHAAELEEALARSDGRLLTLREASAESGYSVAHLRVLLASGALTQAGRRGAPRVLSSELTRKREARVTFDPAAAARQAVRASSAAARKEASDA